MATKEDAMGSWWASDGGKEGKRGKGGAERWLQRGAQAMTMTKIIALHPPTLINNNQLIMMLGMAM